MNPYPLTRPDGTIAAHVCGHCEKTFSVAHYEGRHEDDPERAPEEPYTALDAAGNCCYCQHEFCRAQTEHPNHQFCSACYWWWGYLVAWKHIGMACKLGIQHYAVWRCVQDHLDYGEQMQALHEILDDEKPPVFPKVIRLTAAGAEALARALENTTVSPKLRELMMKEDD